MRIITRAAIEATTLSKVVEEGEEGEGKGGGGLEKGKGEVEWREEQSELRKVTNQPSKWCVCVYSSR